MWRRCSASVLIGVAVFVVTMGLRGMLGPARVLAAGIENSRDPASRELIEVRDISDVVISPDGHFSVFRVDAPSISGNNVRREWYVVSLDNNGKASKIAEIDGPVFDYWNYGVESFAQWSSDSRWVYFRALQGEEVAVWRASVDVVQQKLTNDAANVESFVVDPESPRLFYVVKETREAIKQAEKKEYEQGVVLGHTVQLGDALQHNFPYRGRMTTIRLDKGRWVTLLDDVPPRVMVLELSKRAVHGASAEELARYRLLTTHSLTVRTSPYAISINKSSDGRVAFLGLVDEKKLRQVRWAESTGASTSIACEDPACTGPLINEVRWRAGGKEILFVSQDPSGATALDAWSVSQGTVRTIVQTDGLLGARAFARYQSILCPTTSTEAICTTADASGPPRLEAINLDTGVRRVLFDPNVQLRSRSFGRLEHLRWKDKWGREGTGVLVLPRSSTQGVRLPLVITSYRCSGFLRGGFGSDVAEHVLAASGIASLCVNTDFALAAQPYPSGKIMPGGQHANVQVTLDFWEAAVDLLDRRGLIDPSRVGISGLSFGAQAVHYAISHSHKFSVAAAGHGSGLDPFLSYSMPYGELETLLRIYRLPFPTSDPENIYQEVSPALNVSKINVPLLIQTDEGEFRFGLQYYVNMVQKKKPIEVIVFPKEAHQFVQPIHLLVRNARFIDWFRYWLQGYEDPDPAKTEQYARWRELRRLQEANEGIRTAATEKKH